MGFANVGRVWTAEGLADYLKDLPRPAWCKGVTLHHTAVPSLVQRPAGFKLNHIKNLEHFYRNEKGWSAGPHFFVDEDQCWGLSHPSEPGVHASSFNRDCIGLEILGNYDVEDAETGRGLACWTMAAAVTKVLLDWLGLSANEQTVRFHRDDPATPKQCPGSSIRKSWVLGLIEPNASPPANNPSRVNRAQLEEYLGRNISTICTEVGFANPALSHCAHFVNHVIGFDGKLSCGGLLGKPGRAANIRVHETFAQCPEVGKFEDRPEQPCLAFVTKASGVNLQNKTMANIDQKHVGIFCDGLVWHYSNTQDKVVHVSPPEYARHYPGAGFAVFYGTFPPGSRSFAAPTIARTRVKEIGPGQNDDIDVATWQQFLIVRGLLHGRPIRAMLDGNFGEMTKEATEAFQLANDLTTSGRVDADTVEAAVRVGFIPRVRAPKRTVVTKNVAGLGALATAVLERLSPDHVFYTEQVVAHAGETYVARLEPHKHTTGERLRYWHRGVTVYFAS